MRIHSKVTTADMDGDRKILQLQLVNLPDFLLRDF